MFDRRVWGVLISVCAHLTRQHHKPPHVTTHHHTPPHTTTHHHTPPRRDDGANFLGNVYLQSLNATNVEWMFRDGTLIGVYEPFALLFKATNPNP